MTIEKLGAIQSLQKTNKLKKYKNSLTVKGSSKKDEISISPKAKEALELSKIVNNIVSKNVVRAEKVAEAKKKVEDGFYFTDEVTNKVAEKIAEFMI